MLKGWLQKKLVNWLVRDLFNTISAEDILQFEKDGIYLRGKKLDQQTVEALHEDAEKYTESTLVKLENYQIKYLANWRMFERSQSPEDILASKMALWLLEQQRRFRKRVKEIRLGY